MRKTLRRKPQITQTSPSILEQFSVSLCLKLFHALPRSSGSCMQLCLEAVNDDVHCQSEGMPLGRLPALSSTLLT